VFEFQSFSIAIEPRVHLHEPHPHVSRREIHFVDPHHLAQPLRFEKEPGKQLQVDSGEKWVTVART